VYRAREALDRATSVCVLTGAGISAESGIPTFRDALTGLWANFRPEELATPEAFEANPQLVWEWYEWRRAKVREAKPNAGHLALAALEEEFSARDADFTLVTQNVDGLHAAAGSRRVLELHGNILRTKCFGAQHPASAWPAGGPVPPRCQVCGSPLRPDVVWFGESLPVDALAAAMAAARTADVFLCVGTSTVVEPAASLPFIALEAGARVIEVNPAATPLSAQAHLVLAGPAGNTLSQLVR
jgi:NAD-dependent deacetylase